MPDWFYRTAAQRALFALSDETARGIALGLLGTLGKSPSGRALIEFLGHMDADNRLTTKVGGTTFSSPIGLGWRVDPELRATQALACFGVGCIECLADERRSVVRTEGEKLHDHSPRPPPETETKPATLPLLRRKKISGDDELLLLPSGESLPVVSWDYAFEESTGYPQGVVMQVGIRDRTGGWHVPTLMPADLPARVRAWRQALPTSSAIVVAGGIGNPSDAVALIEAGANLVLVDAGLVFRGPGLVKRCNEALLIRCAREELVDSETFAAQRAWFWACTLGFALAAGGLLTLGLALTRVLLPYDEHYLGLTAETLRRNSPRLFAFMAHDRGTLAGTMLGLGWLYLIIGWKGIRHNVHGTKAAVVASALTGFVSFFAFLGFGYFDPLHAFVAAILLQITVQILIGKPAGNSGWNGLIDDEDSDLRRAQWAQLAWIIHAAGLLIAGTVILGISMTSVFVREDLDFLCMTAAQAMALGERMIAVLAHDRAALGGMLLASGVAMLLPVLWCFRRGASWLWWAMAGLGLPAYAAALGIHLWVGYTDWRHMVPALLGAGLWLVGLLWSGRYLLAKGPTKAPH